GLFGGGPVRLAARSPAARGGAGRGQRQWRAGGGARAARPIDRRRPGARSGRLRVSRRAQPGEAAPPPRPATRSATYPEPFPATRIRNDQRRRFPRRPLSRPLKLIPPCPPSIGPL